MRWAGEGFASSTGGLSRDLLLLQNFCLDQEGEGKVFQQSAEHDLASAEAKMTLAIPLPSGDLDFRLPCWRGMLLG